MLKFLLFIQLVYLGISSAVELNELFAPKQLEIDGDVANSNDKIIYKPSELEVYKDSLFLTIPSNTSRVSLASVQLRDLKQSQKMKAYPNIAAHQEGNNDTKSKIGSAFRIRVDRCDRLWVLDNGRPVSSVANGPATIYPPALIVIDLKSNEIIKKVDFDDKVKFNSNSRFAVDDALCQNTYVYVDNAAANSVLVYSMVMNEYWKVIQDGISVLAITPITNSIFSTLYFNTHDGVSYISTEQLQNKTNTNYALTKLPVSYNDLFVSFVDPKTNVLYYYSQQKINVVHCWDKKTNAESIIMDNNFHAIDIKVVSNNTHSSIFILALLKDSTEFKIFSGTDLVKNTVCDDPNTNPIDDKKVNSNTTTNVPSEATTDATLDTTPDTSLDTTTDIADTTTPLLTTSTSTTTIHKPINESASAAVRSSAICTLQVSAFLHFILVTVVFLLTYMSQ